MLDAGSAFPDLAVRATSVGDTSVRRQLAGSFGVVLLFPGSRCRRSLVQLRAFQRAQTLFERLGVRTFALSADDEVPTKELADTLHLTFPVGYGVDPAEVSRRTGAFLDGDRRHLRSAGFLLCPTGHVHTSVYSSGAVGLLVPEDVVDTVRTLASGAASQPGGAVARAARRSARGRPAGHRGTRRP